MKMANFVGVGVRRYKRRHPQIKYYVVVLSKNMKKQGYKEPDFGFRTYDKAYNFVVTKWGSGVLEEGVDKPTYGLVINKVEREMSDLEWMKVAHLSRLVYNR